MALLQVNFNSAILHRKVPMQVILPTDAGSGSTGPFKTLYLLHGLMDNCTVWTSNTRIERWAMERSLAVVMPSAENSFYVDIPCGSSPFGDFGAYVGQELVKMTRKMFPLSPRREDTFIAGLSMGGFGALRNGLKFSNTFGYIACLSGAIHIFEYALAVNTLAPYLLTCLIHKPRRLIYLSSDMHLSVDPSLKEIKFGKGKMSYSDSKFYVVLLMKAVARKWPDVYANAVDPGWVPTRMGGPSATDDLEKGFETQAWLAVSTDDRANVSGRYFYHRREAKYHPEANNMELQEGFLAECEKITGVHFPSD